MRRRGLILGAVFGGTFAASYLLAAAGQLPADWGGPGAALQIGLVGAVLLTIGIGLNWWLWQVLRSAARPRGGHHRAGRGAYSEASAVYAGGDYSAPADCSGGASSFGGDCGSGV
jgi:hypothetical protein